MKLYRLHEWRNAGWMATDVTADDNTIMPKSIKYVKQHPNGIHKWFKEDAVSDNIIAYIDFSGKRSRFGRDREEAK